MDAKLTICLLLLVLGVVSVQGKNLAQQDAAKRGLCVNFGGICVSQAYECYELEPPRRDCPASDCRYGTHCCCNF